ncbi:MAG: hypothetical protein GM44_0195 [actinobacterium acAMD-2]|jgi:hypothetical protein|nr:MAG: hypothetical protein GM44_0195 [actinobacterium acAMD-2]HAS08436.1 hypothetical protein [Actinomycetota bacterium]
MNPLFFIFPTVEQGDTMVRGDSRIPFNHARLRLYTDETFLWGCTAQVETNLDGVLFFTDQRIIVAYYQKPSGVARFFWAKDEPINIRTFAFQFDDTTMRCQIDDLDVQISAEAFAGLLDWIQWNNIELQTQDAGESDAL